MKSQILNLFTKTNIKEEIVDISYLTKGYSNECYRVTTHKGNTYKVRFGNNNDVIVRDNEVAILRNIGISCYYYDKSNGDSVWSWIEGTDLEEQEITEEIIYKLVEIASFIHNKGTEGVLNHDDLEYFELFKERLSKEDAEIYLKLFDKYKNEERCLCHNDISRSNLIYNSSSKKLTLIDYEWGRVNNRAWDYGNFIKEVDLSEELIRVLSLVSKIEIDKLYEFAILATLYSIQLSYVFKNQTVGLDKYRERLSVQLKKYKECLWNK